MRRRREREGDGKRKEESSEGIPWPCALSLSFLSGSVKAVITAAWSQLCGAAIYTLSLSGPANINIPAARGGEQNILDTAFIARNDMFDNK